MPILVVGSGVSGLVASHLLAQQGYEVQIVEKQRTPIDKVCGEGLLPFGVAALPIGSLRDCIHDIGKPFHGLCYGNAQSKANARFGFNRYGLGLDRAALDRTLTQIISDHPLIQLEKGRKIVASDLKHFSHVLAADGILSPIGKPEIPKTPVNRLGARFRVSAQPPDYVQVHFGKGFELYLTPTGETTLSVAALLDIKKLNLHGSEIHDFIMTRFEQNFPQYRTCGISPIKTRAPIAAPYYRAANKHLLGDALQAFDPISGSGISFAIISAKLAVQHLNDLEAYYRAMEPHRQCINHFTRLLLCLKGGGILTRLMIRQLSKAPLSFAHLLDNYDGKTSLFRIAPGPLLPLLKP